MRKRSPSVSLAMSSEADTRLEGDRQFVVALQRGLEILRCFQPSDGSLGNTELALRSGLPQSTVSRLTYTLSKLGYLVYLEDEGRYRIGLPVLGLGYSCLAGFKIRHAAQPLMDKLADFAGNGVLVALGGRADMSMIYIACARSPGVISLQLDVGSRVSMRRSSMGRAYMSAISEAERQELMKHFEAIAEPGHWPQLQSEIARSFEEIESKGFCLNLGEWHDEVHSIAVPIPPFHPGSPTLAINCGGPAYLLSRDRLENELAPRLIALVRQLQQQAS